MRASPRLSPPSPRPTLAPTMFRRRPLCLPVLCCALAALATAARAADAAFVHLWPGWRDADSFDRITEFLGGAEPAGHRTLLRSRPDARAGYYFLFRLQLPAPVTGATFALHVIRPDSPEPKVFAFPAAAPSGANVFDLGLTGPDWPGGKTAHPVAWKLALLAADGRVLAEHKSFLWEKPAK